MTTARRPIASIKQLIDTWRAGAGTYTTGDVVTVGQHAYVMRDDTGTTIVMGGAPNRENVVGGNTANVDTATSNLTGASALADEDGNWNVIGGGYDTVVNGWACIVNGFHHKVETGGNHATIAGGSLSTIDTDVSYSVIGGGTGHTCGANATTIGGGTGNTASGATATIGGGQSNVASGPNAVIAGGGLNEATATYATIGGGNSNDATGEYATVAGGNQCAATGNYSTVAGGTANTASASNATVVGGTTNVASQVGATVIGGGSNTAAAYYSVAMGYVNAAGAVAGANYDTVIGREAVSGRYGQLCQAGGKFTTVGDAQICRMIARKQTTDATATVMALDGGGTATATRTSIGTDRSAAFSALVVGRRVSAGGEASAAYEIKGLIKNDGGAVAFVGTPSVTVLGETDAAWDCTVNANDTTNALEILVTGAAGVTVNWVAEVTFVESAG